MHISAKKQFHKDKFYMSGNKEWEENYDRILRKKKEEKEEKE